MSNVYDPPESWAGERARLHAEIKWWRNHAHGLQNQLNDLTAMLVESTIGAMTVEHVRADEPPPKLTAREVEVLGLVVDGFNTGEIARQLYITPRTVKNHLVATYRKLGVHDRTNAVIVAARHGLVRLK